MQAAYRWVMDFRMPVSPGMILGMAVAASAGAVVVAYLLVLVLGP
jgi:hypothetical protein